MIEKSLYIMIFMYAASFGILGGQFVLGDVFGIDMKVMCDCEENGEALKSHILTTIQTDQLTTSAQNVIGTNQTSVTTDPITAAAGIAWELFLLMTGTYIFQILYFMGIPSIIVTGLVLLYIIMLMRTIIAYLRGV
tara:strand:- start:907 stop:1314 length:408 start_codon:yes stop_codon:yes gene_type:complete